jgi:citronellol/citronellal dehydrogenase
LNAADSFAPGLFDGQVVLVTGGGTGIGRAAAVAYARLGAKVAVCGRRAEPISETAAAIESSGGASLSAVCDIRDPRSCRETVRSVLERYGRLDVLVNNAGGQFPSAAEHMEPKGWEAVIRNNLNGTFHMTHAAATAAMIPARSGCILNVTANVARGFPGFSHTGAARAGVENLTRSLAVEWAQYRIRVVALAPGVIRSTGTERYGEELLEHARRATPLKRLGTVDEAAAFIVFMTSPAASFMTGAVVPVDGGASLWGDTWIVGEPEGA